MEEFVKNEENSEAVKFILNVAKLLPRFGLTVYELENLLYKLAKFFSYKAEFVILSDVFLFAFGSLKNQRTLLGRFKGGMPNVEKLHLVRKLIIQLTQGEISLINANEELLKIEKKELLYNKWVSLFVGWCMASGGVAIIFGGGFKEVFVAMLIGFLAGVMNIFLEGKIGNLKRLIEPMCALMASIVAVSALWVVGSFSVPLAIICGLIVLMPGYTLTLAMTELSLGHTISGLSNFFKGILTLLFLGLGVVFGVKLTDFLVPFSNNLVITGVSSYAASLLASMLVMFCIGITFNVPKKQLPCVMVVGLLVTAIATYAQNVLGIALGTGVAALFLGVAANLYSHITGNSDVVLKVPCVMILVPGSVGFRGVLEILVHNHVAGAEIAATMFAIGLSIVVGIIFVDILIPPKNFLKI